MARRAKSGRVNPKDYESDYLVSKFTDITEMLKTDPMNLYDQTINNKELSLLTCQIQMFMEEHLGRYSKRPWPITRIPSKMFRDFSANGSLYTILRECFKFKRDQQWRSFSFNSKSKKDDNMELLKSIEEALINARKWRQPCIYFHSNVPKNLVEDLTRVVTRHSGTVVSKPTKATHIVKYDPRVDANENEDADYLRTLLIREDASLAFVHWWYFPDSYDQWLPLADVEGQMPEQEPVPQQRQCVCCRFIKDVAIFNEWMNEGDYEIEVEDGDEEMQVRDKGKKKKRKKEKEDGGKRKRRRASSSEKAADSQSSVKAGPSVVQASTGEFEVGAGGVVQKAQSSLSVAKPSAERTDLQYTNIASGRVSKVRGRAGADEHADGDDGAGAGRLLVPKCARWFDINVDEPHALEKRMLPEFFSKRSLSKTPETYIYYRNYMVKCYRQRPKEYLTATACRRNLAGDACAILRVHEFLQHWGIINYDVDPASRPIGARVPSTAAFEVHTQEIAWHTHTEDEQESLSKAGAAGAAGSAGGGGGGGGVQGSLKMDTKPPEGETGGELQGEGASFVAALSHSQTWTLEQTKALLEAVRAEMQGDGDDVDWKGVAEKVGGQKTADEVMRYFVLMPIQEQFLEGGESFCPSSSSSSSTTSASTTAVPTATAIGTGSRRFDAFGPDALAEMATVLHSMAPNVAAAAVRAALAEAKASRQGRADDTNTDTSEESSSSSSEEEVMADVAAGVVVAAAAVKAQSLADRAELDAQKHLNAVLETQMKKIQLKLKEFTELAEVLRAERSQLEKDKHELYTEKMRFMADRAVLEPGRD